MPVAAGLVVEITTIAAQLDCQPLMMKRQGETKAAPRAADVDAGSCLLCGGVCEVEVVAFFASIHDCVFDCVWVYKHMYSHVFLCACVVCTCTVYLSVCVCVSAAALWL